jgi:hypothetical protein
MRLYALLLIAALAAPACRKPAGSDAEYEEARSRWTELLREKGIEAAYQDPRSEEVSLLLGRVDPKSADAPFAARLRAEIEAGRRQAVERAAALLKQEEEAREAGARAAATVGTRPFEAAVPLDPADGGAARAADAGAAGDQPRVGMEADRFKRDFARCFEYKNASIVQGRTGGEVWGLKDLMICRDLHKPFVSDSVLLMDGKVLAIRPSSELAPKRFQVVDGKLVEVGPDAGALRP